jgi:hypothetical protein
MWELYLFAALTEANFVVARPRPAPDFLVRGLTGEFALEATTINPSVGGDGQRISPPKPETTEEKKEYFKHYLPIRYAGPLTAKLRKAYWEQPAASGKPLVFAIQDFHDKMSMVYSGSALATYLYGFDHEAHRDGGGRLRVIPRQVEEHGSGTGPREQRAIGPMRTRWPRGPGARRVRRRPAPVRIGEACTRRVALWPAGPGLPWWRS